MGGLVIDIYVAFIVRSIIRVFWMIKSSTWRRSHATIVRSTRESDWCPVSYELLAVPASKTKKPLSHLYSVNCWPLRYRSRSWTDHHN